MIKIFGSYKGGIKEEIDTAKDAKEARFLTREYCLAYGPEWTIHWTEKK